MKHLALLTAAGVLLAACAPFQATERAGRIVNVRTGQEGRISFGAGALLPRGAVNIQIGSAAYAGDYTLLQPALQTAPRFSAGFGFSNFGGDRRFPWYLGFDSAAPRYSETGPRQGSIIARSGNAVLSCTFQADASDRGSGQCQDGAGVTYAFQF